jgi:inorganic pyrophosphatase
MSVESVNMLTLTVFIEIAKGSHIKYEYDKEKRALVCDRILHTPFKYEFIQVKIYTFSHLKRPFLLNKIII